MVLFRRFIDILYWSVFALYLSSAIGYISDSFRACATIGILAVLLGLNLGELSFVRAFVELGQCLQEKKIPKTVGGRVAAFGVVWFLGAFILVPLVRHWAFASWVWDLGIFDQITWSGAHGKDFGDNYHQGRSAFSDLLHRPQSSGSVAVSFGLGLQNLPPCGTFTFIAVRLVNRCCGSALEGRQSFFATRHFSFLYDFFILGF